VAPTYVQTERISRPRQFISGAVVTFGTGRTKPKLDRDYSHLVEGIAKEAEAAAVFKKFRQSLNPIQKKIDGRNAFRSEKYMMTPAYVEVSVAK